MRGKRLVVAATLAVSGWAAAPASAETIYGVTDSDKLVSFDSATPGTVSAPITITGLTATETIKGIDFRPATLQLCAFGSLGQLYKIDVATGAATRVGTPQVGIGTGAITGTDFDIDFNPAVDRLRVVADDRQNLRINPSTGGAATADGQLAYAAADTNAGATPSVTGAAYTRNAPASAVYPNAPTTTLYDIDTAKDTLVTQNPPNDGTLNTVGTGLGVDVNGVNGFDIATAADGTTTTAAYAVLRPQASGNPARWRRG